MLDELQRDLPEGIVIEDRIFKQADFIEAAVENVVEAIRDGAIWVVVVLFIFMWNFRTSISSLTAMPISILLTVLIFRVWNLNQHDDPWWYRGGHCDLVDDSIVDIENIYRRLKENRQKAIPEDALKVIYDASCEVRKLDRLRHPDRRAGRVSAVLDGWPRRPYVRSTRRGLHDVVAGIAGRVTHDHTCAGFLSATKSQIPGGES